MHNIMEDMDKELNIDLDTEYKEALKDTNVKAIVKEVINNHGEIIQYLISL